MALSPRMKKILKVMLNENRTISVAYLSESVGLSKRTVQRELEYINSDLKGYGVKFMSKTGRGIWLEGSEDAKAELMLEITSGDSYDVSNRENRRKRLILEILKDKGLKKLFYYSSKFKVSEATISGDLDAIEEWLNRYSLFIVRKPGSGVSIEGTEENYRRAIRDFINENIDTKLLRDSYENNDDLSGVYYGLKQSNVGTILNEDILKRVTDCLIKTKDERVMNFTENSYIGLIIHISIAINRILQDEIIEKDPKWSKDMSSDADYAVAKKIVSELEKEFDIEIPPIETAYICLHLKGAKHEKIALNNKSSLYIENREIQALLNKMIDVFDPNNAFLLKQDDEFIQGLLAHLQPTFIRILHGMNIANPVLDTIKNDYPDIFKRCLNVSKVLGEWLGKEVPEAETGYLTVHFGAAMVRLEGKKEDIRQVNIGVVCSSGIGISRLMSVKLEKIFGSRVSITTYGKSDLTQYIATKLDFFVTSIAMDPQEIPVVFVNPLLSEEDMERIRHMVYTYERSPKKHTAETDFSAALDDINLVASQIHAILNYMEFFKVDNYITFDELLIAISEKLSPYRDRGELIREDLLKREKMGTQIFAEFGFALLHTKTRGVIRPCFTVCMTKDLGEFKDNYFKKIKIVFIMLLPIDENLKTNVEILGYISSMLIEDYTFTDKVLTGNKEIIKNALSVHLKSYFNKFLSRIQ